MSQKNTYYFSHDSNARNDEKVLAVRMRLGAEGYAIYFMILERLLDSTDYTSVTDYNVIAFDLRVGADKVKQVINDFGLFHFAEDGKRFYSNSFTKRMQPLESLRKTRSEAAQKRWGKQKSNEDDANAMQIDVFACQNLCKEKESKEEENKENTSINASTKEKKPPEEVYRSFLNSTKSYTLTLTKAEFEKLLGEGYKKEKIDDMLDRIKNYKGNKGYTSLFLVCKRWFDLDKKRQSQQKETSYRTTYRPSTQGNPVL